MSSAASPATKPERMPGTLERLDRLVKATRLRKSLRPELRCAASSAPSGGFVAEVDLGVALVGGDDEAVAVAQLEQRLPLVPAASPRRSGCRASRRRAAACAPRWRRRCCDQSAAKLRAGSLLTKAGLRAGQQRRAFVDLVERIGADHGGARPRRVDHRLRKREQRLARAVDRQHLRRRVDASTP